MGTSACFLQKAKTCAKSFLNVQACKAYEFLKDVLVKLAIQLKMLLNIESLIIYLKLNTLNI